MNDLTTYLTGSSVLWAMILWISYRLAHGIYNISPFHSLNHIPGPTLAALTIMYEFWFDMVLGGTYTQKIRQMHRMYGKSRPASNILISS